MERNIYNKLLEWKNSPKRKPLIVLGQRQIGKTYILKEFAKNEYKHMLYINFLDDKKFYEVFENYSGAKDLLEQLFNLTKLDINNIKDTLIIIDEIQESSRAITSLKTLNEANLNLNIVATGSYLGYKLKSSRSTFPIGQVEIIKMKQLMFDEFVNALGYKNILDKAIMQILNKEEISISYHNELLKLFNIYVDIGGFPEVINTYLSSNNSIERAKIVLNIIKYGYEEDLDKYSQVFNDKTFLRLIYKSINRFLINENKKFVFSCLDPNKRFRELEKYLLWLNDSNLLLKVNNLKNLTKPIKINENDNYFKLYYNDVGFFSLSLNYLSPETFNNNDIKGGIAESFVISQMLNNFDSIYFYSYIKNGVKYEIDFVVENKLNEPCLIEVKSGTQYKLKSLEKLAEKNKFVLSPNNFSKTKSYINIPIYFAFMLEQIINNF